MRERALTRRQTRLGALVLAGVAVALVSVTAFFRVSLLPSIGRSLSLSATELGVFTMVFGVGRLLTDVPAGRLADRIRPALSFAGAGLLIAAASFGLAAAHAGAVAYAAAFVLGTGSALANTTGMTVFSTSVSRARRGIAMATYSACLLGGQAVGPALAGALSTLGTWRTAETIGGALGLATAALLLLGPGEGATARLPAEASAAAADGMIPPADRAVLYGISFAVFFTLGAMPQTLVPIIGADAYGLGAAAIGLALGLGGICRLTGSLVGGWVSDRVSRKAALVPALALMAAGVALLAVGAGEWLWLVAIVLLSLSSFGGSVAATMVADGSRAGAVGRRLGSFRFVGDLGLIAGPVLAGGLFSALGRATAVLAVAAVPAVFAVAAALLVTETRHLAAPVYEAEV